MRSARLLKLSTDPLLLSEGAGSDRQVEVDCRVQNVVVVQVVALEIQEAQHHRHHHRLEYGHRSWLMEV